MTRFSLLSKFLHDQYVYVVTGIDEDGQGSSLL